MTLGANSRYFRDNSQSIHEIIGDHRTPKCANKYEILSLFCFKKRTAGRKCVFTFCYCLLTFGQETYIKVQIKCFLLLNLKEQQKSGRSPFTVSKYLF